MQIQVQIQTQANMIRSSSIPGKAYKFVLRQDVWIQTNLRGRTFESDWLRVEADGKIWVTGSRSAGYAWDGCTPKANLFHLVVGTPDGQVGF